MEAPARTSVHACLGALLKFRAWYHLIRVDDMLSSYLAAQRALNMDHAQLCCEAAIAPLQQSNAMPLWIVPLGLLGRLF